MHIWLLIIIFSVSRPKVQSQQTLSYHMSLAIPIKHIIIHSGNKFLKMQSIQKKLIQPKKKKKEEEEEEEEEEEAKIANRGNLIINKINK